MLNEGSGRWFALAFPITPSTQHDIKCVTGDPLAVQQSPSVMKKYLPSMDELVSGVVIIIVGLVVWQFTSPFINQLTSKLKPSTAA